MNTQTQLNLSKASGILSRLDYLQLFLDKSKEDNNGVLKKIHLNSNKEANC